MMRKWWLEPCKESFEEDEEEGDAKDEVGKVENCHRKFVHCVPIDVEREETGVLQTKHAIDYSSQLYRFLLANLEEEDT